MFSSLNRRLTLSHLSVALITVVVMFTVASRAILRAAIEQAENRIEDLAFATSNALEDPLEKFIEGEASLTNVQVTVAHWLTKEDDLHYTIFLTDGTPLIDNLSPTPPHPTEQTAPELYDALESDIGEGDIIRPNEQGEEYLYVAVQILHEDHIMGLLRLGVPYSNVIAPAQRTINILLGLVILLLLTVGVGGWLLARNLTAPITDLTTSAQKLTAGHLEARATPSGPQEFQQLAHAFNSMAARLQEHVSNLRAFVANASHELRTPLTTIKLRVEALHHGAMDDPQTARRFLKEIDSEIDRLTAMVNELLDLSQIDAGSGRDAYAPVDLAILIEEACEIFEIRAQKNKIQLTYQVDPKLPAIFGNEEQLRRVLDNLISNAIKHTPKGGTVSLRLKPSEKPNFVCLQVSDTGRGIPARHLPHIFERFYRIEHTRPIDGRSPGSGLGLAIVQSIIEAHGGEIRVESTVGQGTTFIIELPTLPPPRF